VMQDDERFLPVESEWYCQVTHSQNLVERPPRRTQKWTQTKCFKRKMSRGMDGWQLVLKSTYYCLIPLSSSLRPSSR
jgi:hypothetical protein